MKTTLGILGLGLCMSTTVFGASLLAGVSDANMADGEVDGWSGITALSVPIAGGDLLEVNEFSFYASEGRADGSRFVTPLILARPLGSAATDPATIIGIGAEVQVTDPGLNNHPFSLTMGASTLNLNNATDEFLAGFWQRADGVDDVDGGVVAFAAEGGSGMFQRNEDGTTYVPGIGDPVDAGHESAEGGRNYQFNLEGDVIPEPTVAWLFALSGFALMLRRRRD